jgi:hypothetical protein
LGKILTVLVALVSIAVAVLVAREFVLTRNWKSVYETEAALNDRALGERDQALKQRDDAKVAWEKDKLAKEEQVNLLGKELSDRVSQIAILTNEKENQEKRLAELATKSASIDNSLKNLLAEQKGWQDLRDEAMKRADDLANMYAELEARYRNAQADLGTLKETLRQTREEKVALEGRVAWVVQNYPEVKIPEKGPYPAAWKVDGLVTRADNEAKTAEINLGTDSGVVKGMKFVIYSVPDNKYLATLTINAVGNSTAAGELGVIRGTVKANDHVTNKFE